MYDNSLNCNRCGVGVEENALKILNVIKRSENYIV